MGNHRNRFPARRRFLKQSAALSAGAVAVGAPLLALGQSTAEHDSAKNAAAPGAAASTPISSAAAPDTTPAAAAPAQPAALPARPQRRRLGA